MASGFDFNKILITAAAAAQEQIPETPVLSL